MASAYSVQKKPKKPAAKTSMMQEVLDKLADREREVEELRRENRTLQTIQRRHEKELGRQNTDDDGPTALLARKDNEIALFAKQVKLYKEKWTALEKDLKKYQRQLQDYKDKNDELTKLVQQKNLPERATLLQEVDDLKAMLEARDQQITKLEKMLELSEKMNARTQAQHQQQRRADVSSLDEVNSLRATLEFTQLKLAERERQLDSIVGGPAGKARREEAGSRAAKAKAPSAVPASVRGTPAPSAAATPAPTAVAMVQPSRYSPVFDAVRSPVPACSSTLPASVTAVLPPAYARASPMPRAVAMDVARIDSEIATREREVLALSDAIRKAEEARLALEREEHEGRKREEENRLAHAREEDMRRQQEEAARREAEQRERERAEEEAARRREEDERRAARQREEQEILARRRAEEEARVLEERQRVEREQEEARIAIERAKEERRKKDALLARMKELDSGGPATTMAPEKEKFSFLQPSPAPAAPSKPLPSWLQEAAAAQEPKPSAGGPFENMHKGLPARPDLLGPTSTRPAAGASFLGEGAGRGNGRARGDDAGKGLGFLDGPRTAAAPGPAASERASASVLPWESKAGAGAGAGAARGGGGGGGGGNASRDAGLGTGPATSGGGAGYMPSFLDNAPRGGAGRVVAAAPVPARKVERSFADDDDDGLESMVI